MSILSKCREMSELLNIAFMAPGGPEFLFILLVLLLLFGAKDAPRILRKLSDMLMQFRHTANTFKHDVMYGDMRAEADALQVELDEIADIHEEVEGDDEAERNEIISGKPLDDSDEESYVESD